MSFVVLTVYGIQDDIKACTGAFVLAFRAAACGRDILLVREAISGTSSTSYAAVSSKDGFAAVRVKKVLKGDIALTASDKALAPYGSLTAATLARTTLSFRTVRPRSVGASTGPTFSWSASLPPATGLLLTSSMGFST